MNLVLPTLTKRAGRRIGWALMGASQKMLATVTLAGLLAFLVVARADTIHLRSGEKLIGKITKDEREVIVIESKSLGRLKVPREQVERIELDPAPAASPVNPVPGQPFVPPPPGVAMPKPALGVDESARGRTRRTNAPAKHRWFWQAKGDVRAPTGFNSSPASGCAAGCTACKIASWSSRATS